MRSLPSYQNSHEPALQSQASGFTGEMTRTTKHISVCICTYKRPQLLKRLLGELQVLETGGLFTFSIVVADNDQGDSAKGVVLSHRTIHERIVGLYGRIVFPDQILRGASAEYCPDAKHGH